jgi:hypothetical protein
MGRRCGYWLGAILVAGAATAATSTAPRKPSGGAGSSIGPGRSKHGQLNSGFLARALRAGNFLLLIDYDFLEALVASVANVFVDRHEPESFLSLPNYIIHGQTSRTPLLCQIPVAVNPCA